MAFVSMIFAGIVVIAAILGISFVIGLIFLIIGVVNRRKDKYKGRKSPVVCIVIGSLFTAPAVITAAVIIVGIIVSTISTNVKRMGYDNITDKWRNEYVSDRKAADEAVKVLLEAADKGDKEAFSEIFTPNLQKNENFDSLVDEFFETYPVGMSECELEGGTGSSSGSHNKGESIEERITDYDCVLNGEWYKISMELCYRNTGSPDDVGVTVFCIENKEACASEIEYSDDEYIMCTIKDESEITARLIKGHPFEFELFSDRVITAEEISECIQKYNNMSEIWNEIGKPNVTKKYDNCTGIDYYYELVPENGEPRYAYICASYPQGDFLYGYICSDKECFYDRALSSGE